MKFTITNFKSLPLIYTKIKHYCKWLLKLIFEYLYIYFYVVVILKTIAMSRPHRVITVF